MNNIIFALAIVSVLVVGSIFTGFPSPAQKTQAAQKKLYEAQLNLNFVENNAAKVAEKETLTELVETEIWKSEVTIMNNENRIVEINFKIENSGIQLGELYRNRINAIQMKNYKLKKKIESLENNQSIWEKIKREFNQDTHEFAKTLKVLVLEKRN